MKQYELGLYEKAMPSGLSWAQKLQAAKEAGFDYVEMSIDASQERIRRIYMPQEERLELIGQMYRIGLPIRTMCVSALTKYSLGNPDPEKCAYGMEIVRGAMDLAADLGIRVVMIPGYDVYFEPSDEETKKRFLNNLRKVARYAEKTGVLVGLETMENEFMNTVEKAMKYVTLCGSNYMKIYPDIGNLTNAAKLYKADVLDDLELGRGNITSMHLKETLPGRYREVPYGTGHVDFESAIGKAWEMGVRRYVAEFWSLNDQTWQAEIKDAYNRMHTILDTQENETKAF